MEEAGSSLLSLANIGIFLIFGTVVLSMLPTSPFTSMIDKMSTIPYLQNVNWFLPVTECLATLETWLAAITAYYVISLLARWVKVITG